jgi:hypothetical protein
MRCAINSARCSQAALLAAMAVCLIIPVPAAELMSPAQQNALVQKYCAVCHTDAAKNGGLSLEHFDAAQAPPSLMAMLLSKLTGGVLLETASEAPSNASAAALLDQKARSGAMGAAGIPIPDNATVDALIQAFAVESAGSMNWSVERPKNAGGGGPMLTVSIVREMPSTKNAGEAEVYRLIASCNPATREGYIQLAWSPAPQNGTLAASADGKVAVRYPVKGNNKMGNGTGESSGLAALMLAEARRGVPRTGLSFPTESLTISDLFPGETVTFPFATLVEDARQELTACFPGASNSLVSSENRQGDR